MYEELSENFIEQTPPYSVVKDALPDGSLNSGQLPSQCLTVNLILPTPCDLLSAHCDMLSAHCDMMFAHCDMLSAHCDMLSAHCDTLSAHCNMLSAHCDMLSAHCNMPSSSCTMVYSQRAPLELTFDTSRFVSESYSSSPGEPGTPGSQPREEEEPVAGVPIADLLVRASGSMQRNASYNCLSSHRGKGHAIDTCNVDMTFDLHVVCPVLTRVTWISQLLCQPRRENQLLC